MTAEPSLHLFFPENDLALARNVDSYTAPPAAVRLRRAGEALPLWYGEAGDRFVATGINAAWLDGIKGRFGMDIDVFDYRPEAYRAAPWGWSRASRTVFRRLGFDGSRLPGDGVLDRLRELSHRRTAAEVARRLREATGIGEAAVEIHEADELGAFLARVPQAIVKQPWSSSGRGMIAVSRDNFESQRQAVAGMIRRQGSVMAERHYDKALDFAMLFRMSGGRCEAAGLSVFETAGLGVYTGNILAPEDELRAIVCGKTGEAAFEAVAGALPRVLEDVIGADYEGPLGVDMMVTGDGALVPVVEINLRMTMGHLCARFYERYVHRGARGRFMVTNERCEDRADVRGGRMRGGSLNLTPAGGDFNFVVRLSALCAD